MEFRIFTLVYDPRIGGFDDESVAQFMLNKQILEVTSGFFVQEGTPHWSLCMVYRTIKGKSKSKKEPMEELTRGFDPQQLLLLDRLKDWRREKADELGYPPFVIATNRQLAEIVLVPVLKKGDFDQVGKFGKKRIARYGSDIIQLIQTFLNHGPS